MKVACQICQRVKEGYPNPITGIDANLCADCMRALEEWKYTEIKQKAVQVSDSHNHNARKSQ